MCGLAGVCTFAGEPPTADVVERMTAAIAHRGPDGGGVLADGPVGLGARRLAIIDLTDAASQPLRNEDGTVAVAYNGEVYNFRALRAELERSGHRFRSRSDTEVVVHAYEEWGEGCVERLEGMFAFALWDSARRRLLLARDRFGVKPLYWRWRDGELIFGSEVKALLAHPRVRSELCYSALNEYLTFQNLLGDLTLFEGVRLLPAGCTLVLEEASSEPVVRRYWDFPAPDPVELPWDEASATLERLFEEAVSRQLVSDVGVGAYLSGGLDSAFITAVATRQLPRMTTFTAGFDLSSVSGLELSFDERAHAEELANALKTEHYEVVLHAGDMEWVLPTLVWSLEDLRVGQSYPNYYVARLASKFVKVVLSGAGGDELFGGYPWRYYAAPGGDFERGYYDSWQRLVPDEDKALLLTPAALRAAGDRTPFDVFRSVLGEWPGGLKTREERVRASLWFELKTFLHGLLLVEDKLSMAHSLETRVPFLDEALVDFALRLPVSQKLRSLDRVPPVDENLAGKRLLYEQQTHEGKVLLRRTLERLVPGGPAGRAKQGFSAPDATWFRGESIDYINSLLRDPKALVYEFLEPSYVARVLDEHTSGRANRRLLIWSLLCLEWWCRCFLAHEPPQGVARHSARATVPER